MVTLHMPMCSRRLSAGPWWWPRLSVTTAVVRASLVLLGAYLTRFFPCSRQAQGALHFGRYGPEGQLCWVVLLVTILLALCSLGSSGPGCSPSWSVWTTRTVWVGFAGDDTTCAVFLMVVFKPKMLDILVGMDQKDSYAVQRSLAGRRHSCRDTEAHPHFPCDTEISQFRLDKVVDALFYAGRAGSSWSFTCPLCAATCALVTFLSCSSSTRSSTPCRGAEFDPHVFCSSRP